jgi:hypothetical protein
MPRYAVMNNSTVTNVILAETLEDAELVTGLTCINIEDRPEIGIGHSIDIE